MAVSNYANNRGASQYQTQREFIPFCQPEFYSSKDKPQYSGYVDLTVTCCTDLYIGSGSSFIPENDSEFVYSPILVDGKPIIPGSSFKGVVRNLASIVSNGCLPGIDLKKDKLPDDIKNKRCKPSECCIVCDVFGMMGKGSKVIFSDMHSDNAGLKIVEMNQQYSPKARYTDKGGCLRGYKIYPTGDNKYTANSRVKVQVVDKGAVFKGRIHFKKLTEEELCLLMFSMGLDKNEGEDICLKLGGFKNEGIGEVEVMSSGFLCSGGMKKTPEELAASWSKKGCANKVGVDKIIEKLLPYD